jgi:competence protein ComEC
LENEYRYGVSTGIDLARADLLFYQFPTLFIITNFIAIPLSSLILVGEIILCTVYFIQPVADVCGRVLSFLIRCMNEIVTHLDSYSFSSIKNIHVNFVQVVLLYVFIAYTASWAMHKHKSWQ